MGGYVVGKRIRFPPVLFGTLEYQHRTLNIISITIRRLHIHRIHRHCL